MAGGLVFGAVPAVSLGFGAAVLVRCRWFRLCFVSRSVGGFVISCRIRRCDGAKRAGGEKSGGEKSTFHNTLEKRRQRYI